jgi:hypothetical protein
MSDIQTLTTLATPVDAGGCHTRSLVVSAGRPILEALQEATFHIGTSLDALWPIATNSSIDDESVYPSIVSSAIAKALLDSVVAAIENATREQRAEVHHG